MDTDLALSTDDWYPDEDIVAAKDAGTLPEQGEGRADEGLKNIRITGKVPSWFGQVEPSIVELLGLHENWDSYGARPIDRRAVLYALEFLLLAMNERIPPPSIIPVNTGAVQIEWHSRDIDLEVEIEPSGHGHVTCEDRRLGDEWEDELEHRAYLPGRLVDSLNDLAQRA